MRHRKRKRVQVYSEPFFCFWIVQPRHSFSNHVQIRPSCVVARFPSLLSLWLVSAISRAVFAAGIMFVCAILIPVNCAAFIFVTPLARAARVTLALTFSLTLLTIVLLYRQRKRVVKIKKANLLEIGFLSMFWFGFSLSYIHPLHCVLERDPMFAHRIPPMLLLHCLRLKQPC